MINNLNSVLRALQFMWPRLGHKLNRHYKKGNYIYFIWACEGRHKFDHQPTNIISIADPGTDYELFIYFNPGLTRIRQLVLYKNERPRTVIDGDKEITDSTIEFILMDFAQAFLSQNLMQNMRDNLSNKVEDSCDDFSRLLSALIAGKIVSLEKDSTIGGIRLAGIFDSDSDVALHYAVDNLEKWNTQKDQKIILIKDLHELHL